MRLPFATSKPTSAPMLSDESSTPPELRFTLFSCSMSYCDKMRIRTSSFLRAA
jgi:hypothetical protein